MPRVFTHNSKVDRLKAKETHPQPGRNFAEYAILARENVFLLRRKLLRRLAISFSKAADRKPNKPTVRPDG